MKFTFVLILIVSSVLFAQPTEQDIKAVQDAGESMGVDLSFSKETNLNNIEKMCQDSFKKVALSVEKTPEAEAIATTYCVSQWKSLR
jgi:hypothetical protein